MALSEFDPITISRKTKETEIDLAIDMSSSEPVDIRTTIAFFDHMLTAMAFHGGFAFRIAAKGDTHVDPHHLVEDAGLVLGDSLAEHVTSRGPVFRYGHAVIPMDDALSEVTVDACGRPYLVFSAEFPQPRSGDFDNSLAREFLLALTNRAGINLHAACRYGRNGHHMLESLFKALGIALKQAYAPAARGVRSTKGVLGE